MKYAKLTFLFIPIALTAAAGAHADVQEQPLETVPMDNDGSDESDEQSDSSDGSDVSEIATSDKSSDASKERDKNAGKGSDEKTDGATEFPFKKFTLTANPLSFIVLRFSVNFEYMFEQHHGLIVVPSFWAMSTEKAVYFYAGGEVGYHFYTGRRGANGFFIGPSVVYMYGSVKKEKRREAIHFIGGALDLGVQHIWKNGFTLGGGGGFMYGTLKSDYSNSSGEKPKVNLAGILPRLLLTIGYSF